MLGIGQIFDLKQKEQGTITLNLGRFARCLITGHYQHVAFADLPLPPLWLKGGYLHLK